jgi:hypothetical protein
MQFLSIKLVALFLLALPFQCFASQRVEILDAIYSYKQNQAAFHMHFLGKIAEGSALVKSIRAVPVGSKYEYKVDLIYNNTAVQCSTKNKELAAKIVSNTEVEFKGQIKDVAFSTILLTNCEFREKLSDFDLKELNFCQSTKLDNKINFKKNIPIPSQKKLKPAEYYLQIELNKHKIDSRNFNHLINSDYSSYFFPVKKYIICNQELKLIVNDVFLQWMGCCFQKKGLQLIFKLNDDHELLQDSANSNDCKFTFVNENYINNINSIIRDTSSNMNFLMNGRYGKIDCRFES